MIIIMKINKNHEDRVSIGGIVAAKDDVNSEAVYSPKTALPLVA